MKKKFLITLIVIIGIIIITTPFFADYTLQWVVALLGMFLQILCIRIVMTKNKTFNKIKFIGISLSVVYGTWLLGYLIHNFM